MKLYIVEGASSCGKTSELKRFVAEHEAEDAAYFTDEQICDIVFTFARSRGDDTKARSLKQELCRYKYFSIDDIDFLPAGKPLTQAAIAEAIIEACRAGSTAAIAARDGRNRVPILWEALLGCLKEDIEHIVPKGLPDSHMRGDCE